MPTDTTQAPKRAGRPSTGTARTSTQRNADRLAKARQLGGDKISAIIDGEAYAALLKLRAGGATVDEAVSRALILAGAQA